MLLSTEMLVSILIDHDIQTWSTYVPPYYRPLNSFCHATTDTHTCLVCGHNLA